MCVFHEIGQNFFGHEPHFERGLCREPATAAEFLYAIECARQIAQGIPDSKDLLQCKTCLPTSLRAPLDAAYGQLGVDESLVSFRPNDVRMHRSGGW